VEGSKDMKELIIDWKGRTVGRKKRLETSFFNIYKGQTMSRK
jgi:hypothetical protein